MRRPDVVNGKQIERIAEVFLLFGAGDLELGADIADHLFGIGAHPGHGRVHVGFPGAHRKALVIGIRLDLPGHQLLEHRDPFQIDRPHVLGIQQVVFHDFSGPAQKLIPVFWKLQQRGQDISAVRRRN